jgi:hypothetical protein
VFYQCRGLVDLRLADIDAIGPESFAECPLVTVHLPMALARGHAAGGRRTYTEFLAVSPVLADAFSWPGNASRFVDVRWV